MDTAIDSLLHRRLRNWAQTEDGRIPDAAQAAALIERVGIATLYPASPEIPNLFHAYTGDSAATTDSGHSSPSGHVYAWRWDLGRAHAAFYSSIVRRRPTWVSWPLLPAIFRLLREPRTTDELFDRGMISSGAYRIAEVLAGAEQPLSTGELRRLTGFPTGKEHRAAYLKAVDELESRLLLAKTFAPDDLDMRHALTEVQYRDEVEAAEGMTREDALRHVLTVYLPAAVFAVPMRLAKHLGLTEAELRAGLERLEAAGHVRPVMLPAEKTLCYQWIEKGQD